MIYLDFKAKLQEFLVFSLADVKNFYPDFDRRRLSEWQEKGYIEMIVRGYYRFTDSPLNEPILFIMANKIYQPSYVSLEMALSYYHLIPEGVYTVTSVGPAKTQKFETPVATFAYQSLRQDLMFGMKVIPYHQHHFSIGEIEKVLLDYFYLHPELRTSEKISGLRLNENELMNQVDWQKLITYEKVYQNKALDDRIKVLKMEVTHA